ncbi:MAG: sulfotransferase [Actinobacteria bacterium]|nr:sulfotransferase [Actinomycetota bacterium]
MHPKALWEPERYCFFIGYPRSGHTLVASLLNAHPEIIISHELDALKFIRRSARRTTLFGMILARDRWFVGGGSQWTGYDYALEGLSQGSATRPRVIGDKCGGHTSLALSKDPHLVDRLRATVRLPCVVIHITRNPYDNIARMARRSTEDADARTKLEHAVDDYVTMARAAYEARSRWDPELWIDMRHEDFCLEPATCLVELTTFLGVEPHPAWLEAATDKVHESPNLSRYDVEWPPETIARVQSELVAFDILRDYRFDP